MTGHQYPPPPPAPEAPPETMHINDLTLSEQLDHVPWFHIYVPDDYLETSGIYMLTKRQARKRDKAKAKARKLRNPRLARRRNRRQIITFVIFFIVVLGVIFKLPEDPFNKHPAPPSGPAITQPATVTTVTP